MRRRALTHLVCPIDRQALDLHPFSERHVALTEAQRAKAAKLGIAADALEHDIVEGVLYNPRLKVAYPILRGVPRLLVFRTALHEQAEQAFGPKLRETLPEARFSDLPSAPGEADVLRSFSAEWTNYDWTGDSYWNLKPDAWFRAMRTIVQAPQGSLDGKTVLEVGVGIGAFANHLAEEEQCELVGIDLGYAVDAAVRHFGDNPFLHLVQASVFCPPFAEQTFDYVYSFGVLHHTYSTKAAFDQVSRLPRLDGRLFVWVYSHHDEERSGVRRSLMRLESVTRPFISRLPDALQTAALTPFVPLYIAYQGVRRVVRGPDQTLYGVREAMHAARDRFAPRFIHRHTEEEMKAWFLAAGYRELIGGNDRTHEPHVPEPLWACSSVMGTRQERTGA